MISIYAFLAVCWLGGPTWTCGPEVRIEQRAFDSISVCEKWTTHALADAHIEPTKGIGVHWRCGPEEGRI